MRAVSRKKKDKKKAGEDIKEEEAEKKKQPEGKLCSCAGCLDSPPDPEASFHCKVDAVQIIKRPMKQEGSWF